MATVTQQDRNKLIQLEVHRNNLLEKLHQVHNARYAIVNKKFNMIERGNCRTPVLATVAVGGVDKTIHFLEGRNAVLMSKVVEEFQNLPNSVGGGVIRHFMEQLCIAAKTPIKQAEVPDDISVETCTQMLVTAVLLLSNKGIRDSEGCLMITKSMDTEVHILFTHLLAWAQFKILESHPEFKKHIPADWLKGNSTSGVPIHISSMWRKFNESIVRKNSMDVNKLRCCMRHFLYSAMPVKTSKKIKTVDLRSCALLHLQSRSREFFNIHDAFMDSVQGSLASAKIATAENTKVHGGEVASDEVASDEVASDEVALHADLETSQSGVASTEGQSGVASTEGQDGSKKKPQREKGCSWPADVTPKSARAACVALTMVFSKLKVHVLKASKLESIQDPQIFLECVDRGHSGQNIREIVQDPQMGNLFGNLSEYQWNAETTSKQQDSHQEVLLDVKEFQGWFEWRLTHIYDGLATRLTNCSDPDCRAHDFAPFEKTQDDLQKTCAVKHMHDFASQPLKHWENVLKLLQRMS